MKSIIPFSSIPTTIIFFNTLEYISINFIKNLAVLKRIIVLYSPLSKLLEGIIKEILKMSIEKKTVAQTTVFHRRI